MLIILEVESQSLAIKVDTTNRSTNVESRYKLITGLFVIINFDRFQLRNNGNTKTDVWQDLITSFTEY